MRIELNNFLKIEASFSTAISSIPKSDRIDSLRIQEVYQREEGCAQIKMQARSVFNYLKNSLIWIWSLIRGFLFSCCKPVLPFTEDAALVQALLELLRKPAQDSVAYEKRFAQLFFQLSEHARNRVKWHLAKIYAQEQCEMDENAFLQKVYYCSSESFIDDKIRNPKEVHLEQALHNFSKELMRISSEKGTFWQRQSR